ncbi:MAG: hypothetical protein J1D88_02950 [Treponema sp.]|nr:hypothetical protein [Treponema sp.]
MKIKAFGICAAVLVCFSCASAPKPPKSSGTDDYVPDDTDAISLKIPEKTSRAYFSTIKPDVLALAENASPESLRRAASLLHKSDSEQYAENERVLLATCAAIMRIVWPSQTVNWEVPDVTVANPYLGAIESAKRGLYDSSTGNTDFLTTVLPSLVLVTSESRTEYFSQAESALRAGLSLRANSVLANYLMGLLLFREEKFLDALRYLTIALNGAPDCQELVYAHGMALFKTGDSNGALASAERLLSYSSQNVKALELAAEAAYASGNSLKTETYVNRVLQLEPENLQYVLFRARILMNSKDYIRASSLLDVYARTDTTSRDYLLLRAQLLRDWNKNNTGAAETIEKALLSHPDDIEVLQLAAELASSANVRIGQKSAQELADAILALDANNATAMAISINEKIKSADWQDAYTLSGRLIADGSASDAMRYKHVDICIALGRMEEANRIASALYSAHPLDEDVQQAYIKVLVASGRRTQASQLISQLLPNATQHMKSFLYYERSLLGTTEDSVLGDLRSSLTANPRNRDALFRLYQIYYNKKDWRKAQYYLKQVVALNSSDPAILKLNAELDSLLGR